MKLIVTGGSGFIGTALILYLLERTDHHVLNLDKLTYAGNNESLAEVENHPRYSFSKTDICDHSSLRDIVSTYQPDGLFHLAAESHVDRSIEDSKRFITTNILGTHTLLEVLRGYLDTSCSKQSHRKFRLLHVSTDEVYGDLEPSEAKFSEKSPYDPRSPYSASKAASDHLVRAWSNTYGLPVLITNSSNNYGPRQFPEKLIPHMLLRAISGKPLPLYGDGAQVRDWLHVEDHVDALWTIFRKGVTGETYNVGGNHEMKNHALVEALCDLLDKTASHRRPKRLSSYRDLIMFVDDRPGHDRRYALDTSRIAREFDWHPTRSFSEGLQMTVDWYLSNEDWWKRILSGDYQLQRLGTNP